MRGRHKTILVVDDEESDRGLMAHLLRRQGYRVLLAGNYYEAFAKIRAAGNRIRLLITDVALPGSNGCELAETMAHAARSKIEVLFVSGEAGSRMLPYYGVLKTDAHFLRKPLAKTELLKRVAELLRTPKSTVGTRLRLVS